jgi:hypothetical protein
MKTKTSKLQKLNTFFVLMGVAFAVLFFSLLPAPSAKAGDPAKQPGLSIKKPAPAIEVDTMTPEGSDVDTSGTVPSEPGTGGGGGTSPDGKNLFAVVWAWLMQNKEAALGLLFVVLDAIVRLTPTEKDNNLLRLLQSWLDKLIPNRKKGGGQFAAFQEPDDAPALAAVVPKAA